MEVCLRYEQKNVTTILTKNDFLYAKYTVRTNETNKKSHINELMVKYYCFDLPLKRLPKKGNL